MNGPAPSTRPALPRARLPRPGQPGLRLAANDNAADDAAVLAADPRARVALSVPLRQSGQVPAAACRRWHAIAGDRVLSSTLVVDAIEAPSSSRDGSSHDGSSHDGSSRDEGPRWRASATLWGFPTRDRRKLALLLVQELLAGLGEGDVRIEVHGSTTIARRRLTAAERRLLATDRLALAVQL